MLQLPVYMDNNATTRTDPRVLEAMLPYFTEHYGNAASRHRLFGRDAASAVEEARAQVASLPGPDRREIGLTSRATERDKLAINGVSAGSRNRRNHTRSGETEHHR